MVAVLVLGSSKINGEAGDQNEAAAVERKHMAAALGQKKGEEHMGGEGALYSENY